MSKEELLKDIAKEMERKSKSLEQELTAFKVGLTAFSNLTEESLRRVIRQETYLYLYDRFLDSPTQERFIGIYQIAKDYLLKNRSIGGFPVGELARKEAYAEYIEYYESDYLKLIEEEIK